MKQRGRHRRRKRGRALRATLAGAALALTATATMISASQATNGDDPGALAPLSTVAEADALSLAEDPVPDRSLNRLTEELGAPVGVNTVLAETEGTLRDTDHCPSADRSALPVSPEASRAYCWDEDDTRGWRAGAVTTSGDADDDGRWGRHQVVLSGWSRTEPGTGPARDLARVAFVNADETARPDYSWALLVVPVDGGRDYRGLFSGLTGMVWYQDKLVVTTTAGDADALYVFDLDRIHRATVTAPTVGRVDDGWSAAGQRFVLPAVATYRPAAADGARPDTLSLDRSTTPDTLVASERVPEAADRASRLWRYRLSTDTARPGPLSAGTGGRSAPQEAYETDAADLRGVLAYRSQWYLSRPADSPDDHGTLWRQDTDGARATECGADEVRDCWSGRPAPLSYWEESGEVWSQSDRTLFALPLTSLDDALE
ncbi:hypothetical protein ACIQNG_11675 [Streptomyces sp. NPDC091377]|uniref:hypothetical protein n=1 Tax=Streptomyces sp. NPDC091377 TaxID=3365995 RepID=UPI00381BFA18